MAARYSQTVAAQYRQSTPTDAEFDTHVVHPYVGYVFNSSGDRAHAAETFGYVHNRHPLPLARSAEQLNILVAGGSVAAGLAGGGYLEKAYYRRFPDAAARRKPLIFSAAIPGYKQPQQALAPAYLVSVGAKLDIVINLDGYNEVALPYVENYLGAYYQFFPRGWLYRIAERGLESKVVGELRYLDFRKEELVRALATGGIYRSAIMGVFAQWRINDIIDRIRMLYQLPHRDEMTFEQSGPYRPGLTMEQVVAESVDVWAQSSTLMRSMARDQGIDYFHVLQPNQYVADSKPFSPEETASYILPPDVHTLTVRMGYRLLIARGRSSASPDYIDATSVFADEKRTVYVDACCHFNDLGYDMLADLIIRRIGAR